MLVAALLSEVDPLVECNVEAVALQGFVPAFATVDPKSNVAAKTVATIHPFSIFIIFSFSL